MGKKGTKRKTRWRILPIGGEDGCNGVCSNNEDEADGDRDSASPLNSSSTTDTSYARASAQRMPRTKPTSSRGSSYNYRHRSYYQPHDSSQPLVTTEKKTFNEEEYTKITTPRQDVLFKKGYLGRKRPTAAPTVDTTANVNNSNTNPEITAADVANGNFNVNGTYEQDGEPIENDQTTSSDVMSPVEEHPQYIYATNGYVDQTGGPPPGLYYINGSGYELYDPYSGNVTVVVGPAPHYGGPGGGPPVLAAVPCQPLPLQPLEWFNPAFLPYVTAPCHNGLATARDRRKRYSTDSQNCSPQSSESTEPPGSPQECDMEATQAGEPPGPALYTQAPAYVYPGYMFGPPMYNVNGVTVQGAPTQLPICDITGSNKRRKKKKRRRRRRGGAEDGCSEVSSSDEKELEEPMSVTSQESSSQEIESDSKQSTTLNNDSSTLSPLSSCQTLTPTDLADSNLRKPVAPTDQSTQLHSFNPEIPLVVNTQQSSLGEKENINAPSVSEQNIIDTCSSHNCDAKSAVEELNQQSERITKDNSEDLNSVPLIKDHTGTEELDLHSSLCTLSSSHSLQEDLCESQTSYQDIPCDFTTHHSAHSSTLETQSESNGIYSATTRIHTKEFNSSEDTTQERQSGVQYGNGKTSSVSNESISKIQDATKPLKTKKSSKQANVKHKNSKGKEEKQKRPKTSVINCSADSNLERLCKNKEGHARNGPDVSAVIIDCRTETHSSSSVNSIPSKITTEVTTFTEKDSSTQEEVGRDSSHNIRTEGSNTLFNGLDRCQISKHDSEGNSIIEMDGNEKKSTSAVSEPISSEESAQSGRISHNNGTGKHNLFPEFKSCFEGPPTRPARKEKRKSSPTNALSPNQNLSDVLTKSSITAKQLQLPTISLRPDIPKTEHKCLHEVSLTPQLKGTADILESITTALTTEPPVTKTLQATVHKENPVFQEADYTANTLHPSESSVAHKDPVYIAASASVVQCFCPTETEKLLDTHEDISGQATAVSVSTECETDTNKKKHHHEILKPSESKSSQKENDNINEEKNKVALKYQRFEELPQCTEFQDEVQSPVPPPRGKKLLACKHKLTEHSQIPELSLEGGNDESLSDSTTSSTTHESEESVIELLSSTHTNPDDRPKQDFSSDEEEEIIFRAKMAHGKTDRNIKSVPPDKPNICAPSTSGPCLQDYSKSSCEDKLTTSKMPSKPWIGNISLKYSEIYADGLSEVIISEAVSESSKKRMCLPITEAVTRWLRSQSPEVLSLPPPEDETESEGSSEEQDSEEGKADETENKKSAGQKNVFCNPLPVLLLEDCHCLSFNSDIKHSGYNSGTGRRVAVNDFKYYKLQNGNIVADKYDNNIITVSVSIEGDKRLINMYDDKNYVSFHKDSCVSLIPVTNTDHKSHERQGQIKKSIDEESLLTQFSETVTNTINYKNEQVSPSSNICETTLNGFNHKNDGMNTAKDRLQNEIILTRAQENSFQNTSQDICEICINSSDTTILNISSLSQMNCRSYENEFHVKNLKNENDIECTAKNCKSDLLKDYDECSFTSEGTLECEWDIWDCNPVKLLPVLTTPKNQTPVEDILAETPDNYCSHMCDPTVSVAKYYSLGTLQKKSDDDELSSNATDSTGDEVDALKHFQYEMEDDDGLQTAPLLSNGTGNLKRISDEEHNGNKIYGNPDICKGHYRESGPVKDSGIQFQEEAERCKNVHNVTLLQRAQTAHLFHRKSSVLVSKLKGDGPFPCGGICCILQ
ncbi:uncharacterized protein LOC111872850 isoform X2 [Cryptotermes secundus]|uniref:uncharacterized protein LOC111872850 isoform X2 n=1 Tax=Cryptotermes secundus TaxID=105785 RepID=UPI000CD7B89B|nr:uncharacterized protein LOC111872850 isoform X2 [Cryptotermes secundus]XP_023722823.1 uncharacterized protein LOC111872850 isoform X2 [Cryptotermes secundus]